MMDRSSSVNEKRILLVYIEPTPYIAGLIKKIIIECHAHVDVLFLKENASQNWNISIDQTWQVCLPGIINQLQRITKIIHQHQYDLIHIAGWREPALLYLIATAKLRGIPLTLESDTPMPHYTKRWKHTLKQLIYPRVFSLIHLFLPGGKRQADYLSYFGVNEERIVPVQMTVDVTSIKQYVKSLNAKDRVRIRRTLDLDENDIVYVYVGRLEPHKGIMDLLVIFEAMRQPSILLLVGDGSLRSVVEQASRANPNIHYAGRLTASSLLDIYFASDVVVLPSHFEPWGLVVNEAMAVGKPVIVSNRVGCIDDLVTSETGIVIQAENSDDLRQAVERLAAFPHERMKMGECARELISTWTLENEAANMCNAWKQLICRI